MTDREWKTIRTIRDSRKSKKKKTSCKKEGNNNNTPCKLNETYLCSLNNVNAVFSYSTF